MLKAVKAVLLNVEKNFKKYALFLTSKRLKLVESAVANVFYDVLDGIFKVRIGLHQFFGLINCVYNCRMIATRKFFANCRH